MIFELPLPPNTGNQRGHWRTRERQKKDFWKACDNLQYFPDFPYPPRSPMERVTIQATWFVHNRMDPDGAVFRLKYVLDWLRTRGYIADDREANVTLLPPVQHIDRKSKRLVLEVLEA
jgi:hypothetical protein